MIKTKKQNSHIDVLLFSKQVYLLKKKNFICQLQTTEHCLLVEISSLKWIDFKIFFFFKIMTNKKEVKKL